MTQEEKAREQRFDICFRENHATIEPHFCREWDEDGGCYGTNPDHGYSFDDACNQVAEWHEMQARLWRTREHHEALYYSQDAMLTAQGDVGEENRDDKHEGGDTSVAAMEEALGYADAWLRRWAVHVGSCKGGDECTCGLTRIRYDVATALAR